MSNKKNIHEIFTNHGYFINNNQVSAKKPSIPETETVESESIDNTIQEAIEKPKLTKKHYVNNDSLRAKVMRYQEIDDLDDGSWLNTIKNKDAIYIQSKRDFYEKNNARRAALTPEQRQAEEEERKMLIESISKDFLRIIKGRLQTYQFNKYDEDIKNEMRQNSILMMISKIRNFKREQLPGDEYAPNIFSYATQVCYIECIRTLRDHYSRANQNVSLSFIEEWDDSF